MFNVVLLVCNEIKMANDDDNDDNDYYIEKCLADIIF